MCKAPGKTNCSPIKEDYGGTWYCFPDVGLNQPVPHGTKYVLVSVGILLAKCDICLSVGASGSVLGRVFTTSVIMEYGLNSQERPGVCVRK